jgi:UDP-4-amino-4,6-dideoxy-L-N-acetyl-beta-L-altrosamine transaminase
MTHFIPYSRQSIDEDDIKAVSDVLRSDFITQGPKISEFEDALASYCGARHAVVFNSGTSALHGAYFVSGLKEGDEFITTPNTFVATANAGLYLGAIPVFVDIELDTGTINADIIEQAVTNKTKAIIPVHYAGHPCDMEHIFAIAQKHGLIVIEDACHALGAKYKNGNIGSCEYSDMAVFSFHPLKSITTGEGGAVLTNNKIFYKKLLTFRSHGILKNGFINEPHGEWYYEMQSLGYNYRMTDIQAALGLSQLKKLDFFIERRRYIAQTYNEAFQNNPILKVPFEKKDCLSAFHLFVLLIDFKLLGIDRQAMANNLKKLSIGTQVHYIPIYYHPYYKELLHKKECPVAESYYERCLSIPLHPKMTDDDIKLVPDSVLCVVQKCNKIKL